MASPESPEEEKDGSLSGATDRRAGPSSRSGFAASRTCHVLLVEDDEPTRFTISTLLTKCDYKVTSTTNGREALEVLEGENGRSINLILTDILMPELNGMELICEVVQRKEFRSIPVIVMSSEADQNTMMEAFQAGAADYLIKPVRRNEIVPLWQHVWRSKNRRGEPSKLTAAPSGSDATWNAAWRTSGQSSGGRFSLKGDKRARYGWGSGDDLGSHHPVMGDRVEGPHEPEEGGSGDSSGNASQTRLADAEGDLNQHAAGVSGRSVDFQDLAQSQDPPLGLTARSEQAAGQPRGGSHSPDLRAAGGTAGRNSGSRGNSSEASREGTPLDDRAGCLPRTRDLSRFTLKRSTSTRYNSSSSGRQNGSNNPDGPSNGDSRGVDCSGVGPNVPKHHYRDLLANSSFEGQGEQASGSVHGRAEAERGAEPAFHCRQQSNTTYSNGFVRWTADKDCVPVSSHISSSILAPQKAVNTSLHIQPLNVEPLHPTASKVGKEWPRSAALQNLLSRGNSNHGEKRPLEGSGDDEQRDTKQDDESSISETVLSMAESLRHMKHAKVGGEKLSAFSAYGSPAFMVPRPCERGDTSAERRVDTIQQTKWGLAQEGSNTLDSGGKECGEVVQGWAPQPQVGVRPDVPMHHFLQAMQAVQDNVQVAYDPHYHQSNNTAANRRAAIVKFREKRKARNFDKKVRYESRRRLAEQRPRCRGQFVKASAAQGSDMPESSVATTLILRPSVQDELVAC